MAILDYTELSVEEQAKRNLLPEQLNIVDIVDLWHTDKRDREVYYQALFKAFNDGNLRGKMLLDPRDFNNFIGGLDKYWNIEIIRADFLDWLKAKNEPLPKDCLLAKWWQAEPVTGTGTTGNQKAKDKHKPTSDKLRTAHFIEWVAKNEYKGGQTNYYLQDELRQDKPELWGKNKCTFDKWLQSEAAKPAKYLIDNLNLDARIAV